ncbi:MAG TPA: DUF3887 domain-containing protein [Lacisediminihabitans sp.]|uniref:DUF3887 domain-containing protein n=1 Tax=Lacisediminihabitans sp. TaxID=2787631 RepID=UPI002ED9372D
MAESFLTLANQLHRDLGAIVAAPVLTENPDPAAAVRASVELQSQVTALVAAAAEQARGAGATWQEIGQALGVTRQAAFQRFGKPIDPRTGETMNTVPLPEAATLAEAVIDELSTGRWDEVAERFDSQMRERLGSEGLAAAWAQVIGLAGAYERRGEVEAARAADVTITNTPLAFEAGDFTARISFRDDQTIAGLYLLATEPKTS